MSRRRPCRGLLHALALCAVALLNVAVVKSTLMQASMGAAAETCREAMPQMPGMAGKSAPLPGKAGRHACEYCAAAAHAPVCTSVPAPVAPPTTAWVRWAAVAGLGARGPPPVEARARGPPLPPLTIA